MKINRILYAILMASLFTLIQLLTWDSKDVQFVINVILFGLLSYNLYHYYEKSKLKNG